MVKDLQILSKKDSNFTSTMKDRLSKMLKCIISCNPFLFLTETEDLWKISYFVLRIQYLLVYKIKVAFFAFSSFFLSLIWVYKWFLWIISLCITSLYTALYLPCSGHMRRQLKEGILICMTINASKSFRHRRIIDS